jgi:SAM-dependent methyltransferase
VYRRSRPGTLARCHQPTISPPCATRGCAGTHRCRRPTPPSYSSDSTFLPAPTWWTSDAAGGELLLRAVGADGTGSTTGTGVDTDDSALARGRALAANRSLDKRVTFLKQEAATWREPADRVMCIGASHAFGGTPAALKALADLVQPGGRLLFGEGSGSAHPRRRRRRSSARRSCPSRIWSSTRDRWAGESCT